MSLRHVLLVLLLVGAMPVVASARLPGDRDAILETPAAATIDSFMAATARLGVEGTLLVERDGCVSWLTRRSAPLEEA